MASKRSLSLRRRADAEAEEAEALGHAGTPAMGRGHAVAAAAVSVHRTVEARYLRRVRCRLSDESRQQVSLRNSAPRAQLGPRDWRESQHDADCRCLAAAATAATGT